ncbi:hypothetical protein DPEC_G00132470 [Dallia pectoralis]|uniref:Uncharacterized protein n=1 Tax=Dallia pectoralis TaxID=75939 RepID=A0ACC2GSC0_DALPE|nr:hypothetical protein DPEC_G00132470 [Dallia pectoralis]
MVVDRPASEWMWRRVFPEKRCSALWINSTPPRLLGALPVHLLPPPRTALAAPDRFGRVHSQPQHATDCLFKLCPMNSTLLRSNSGAAKPGGNSTTDTVLLQQTPRESPSAPRSPTDADQKGHKSFNESLAIPIGHLPHYCCDLEKKQSESENLEKLLELYYKCGSIIQLLHLKSNKLLDSEQASSSLLEKRRHGGDAGLRWQRGLLVYIQPSQACSLGTV